jgi:preprotein translocase subunit SecF
MFSVTRFTKIWLSISSLFAIASIIALAVFGLNLSIEFTGGTFLEVEGLEASVQDIRSNLSDAGYAAEVQLSEDRHIIRTDVVSLDEYEALTGELQSSFGEFEVLRYESIGPVIGQELIRKSAIAIALVLLLVVLYVAYVFRKTSSTIASWKYGLLTIVAALHDVLIPLGIFAVLGVTMGIEVSTAFIAAVLTILGYSINDTIVIFDRIRENILRDKGRTELSNLVDMSVRESIARSINTSITTFVVLAAIFFFGGSTTQSFVLALMLGILSGAYSSIFLASPLLVLISKRS